MGRCLHTYDLRKGLNLVFLTRPQTPENITATCVWKDRVFAAWGNRGSKTSGVWIFKRGKKIAQLETLQQPVEAIQSILIFGSWIVGCSSNRIEVWRSATYEHDSSITPRSARSANDKVLCGAVCSMPTFLNKVFVGKNDGAVDIWNVSTSKLIYTIQPPSITSGPVSTLEPSTALSVLAIAREDGSICLHDVRSDQVVLSLRSKGSAASVISSISFRTDGLGAGDDGQEQGVMATASRNSGDITLWDLNNGGKVTGILRGAHNPASVFESGEGSGVNKVAFLPGQAVIVTSGLDNALKSWIFDANSLSPIPRILHSRCGHAASVTGLNFVPSNSDGSETGGKWLMSAGRDQSLWGWSLRRDGQSTELSQGSIQKKAKKLGILGDIADIKKTTTIEDLKAPEIISMACSLNRDGGMGGVTAGTSVWTNTTNKKSPADAAESSTTGWESIVTGHRGDKYARTWSWGRKRAGRWSFETGDSTEVTTVAMTTCGTFALVGSAGGSIIMYNLQSGVRRQRFPSALTPAQARKLKLGLAAASYASADSPLKYGLGEGKHTKAVTGLMVDALNETVISSSLDGRIKFWDFATGYLQDEINWFPATAILASRYHIASDLVALSCDDLSVRVIDTETKKTVRELWGCLGQISDFCFSNDGRWIIAASVDSVIRVWDLPTGHLINALRLESPCTALAFSDTGEFLATAHADSVGIYLWNNRTLFTHVPTRPLREDEVIPAIAPTSSGEGGQGILDAAFDTSSDDEDEAQAEPSHDFDDSAVGLADLDSTMQTLSLVPKSRWQTLLHLDTIRQRNKPISPPKAPEQAPFFLPSILEKTNENDQSTSQNNAVTTATTNTTITTAITPSERSRISKTNPASSSSSSSNNAFTTLLAATTTPTSNNPPHSDITPSATATKALITHLSHLPPSSLDIELRSLHPRRELTPFIRCLTHTLRQKRDFELVQAWMAVVLRVHGEGIIKIMNDDDDNDNGDDDGNDGDWDGDNGGKGLLREALMEWKVEQERETGRVGELVGWCAGVVGFLRSAR